MTWAAGRPLVRLHPLDRDATAFSTGGGVTGRFHFFHRADGLSVPALYAAENNDAAIAETLFRDVPLSGLLKVVPRTRLAGLALSTIEPARDLTLVELLGNGLRRLELSPEQLTSSAPADYPNTVAWA